MGTLDAWQQREGNRAGRADRSSLKCLVWGAVGGTRWSPPAPGKHYLSSYWKMFSEATLQMAWCTPLCQASNLVPFGMSLSRAPLELSRLQPQSRSCFPWKEEGVWESWDV